MASKPAVHWTNPCEILLLGTHGVGAAALVEGLPVQVLVDRLDQRDRARLHNPTILRIVVISRSAVLDGATGADADNPEVPMAATTA